MADRFYVGPSGGDESWDLNGNWAASTGGAGGASFPIAGDKAIFNSIDPNGNCT